MFKFLLLFWPVLAYSLEIQAQRIEAELNSDKIYLEGDISLKDKKFSITSESMTIGFKDKIKNNITSPENLTIFKGKDRIKGEISSNDKVYTFICDSLRIDNTQLLLEQAEIYSDNKKKIIYN